MNNTLSLEQLLDLVRKPLRLEPISFSESEKTWQISKDERDLSLYASLLSHPQSMVFGVLDARQQPTPQELQVLLEHSSARVVVYSHASSRTRLPAFLVETVQQRAQSLWVSPLSPQEILTYLNDYLKRWFAPTLTLSGVFLNVLHTGVLLTGESGIGKSEIGFHLIQLGHQLVADDAVVLSRLSKDYLLGSCDPLLQDFLELRGLGILNIRALMGEAAIVERQRLNLIIRLLMMSHEEIRQVDRLEGIHSQKDILGVSIPEVTLPVAPGRNMALLIEGAVRHHLLKLTGVNPVEEFIQRQARAIEREQLNEHTDR